MKKKFFVILLSLLLVAALVPAVVVPLVLSADSNNHGWDITILKEKIKNKNTFIAYYGRKTCPACARLTKIIKENQILKNAFSKFEKKHDIKNTLHWFYNEDPYKEGNLQIPFQKNLNKIVVGNNFPKIEETPTLLYFKKGKLVKIENPLISVKPAEMKDTVWIDFKGKIDGEIFEGGAAKNHKLKLGSKSFIDGFESGLVGTQPGEEKTLKLKFPKNYHKAKLADKKVEFKVKINKIKKDPSNQPSDQQVAVRLAKTINNDNW